MVWKLLLQIFAHLGAFLKACPVGLTDSYNIGKYMCTYILYFIYVHIYLPFIYSPQKLVNKDQLVMKCPARLVCKAPRPEHVTFLLVELHWFPVKRRIEYKIDTICYSMITCTAPPYLSDLPELYTTSRILRSSAYERMFPIPNRQGGEREREKNQG